MDANREVIPLTPISHPSRARLTRRSALKLAFWTSLASTIVASGATVVNTLYPRQVEAFGGPVFVPASLIPAPGAAPAISVEGHFLLVNLLPDEGRAANDTEPSLGGLLALWWRCPHLGCTVPWKGSFISPNDPLSRRGNFNCNCHGSTYTRAGVLVRGPAQRGMDTMRIAFDSETGVTVQTGERSEGGDDNPRRAVPWPPVGQLVR